MSISLLTSSHNRHFVVLWEEANIGQVQGYSKNDNKMTHKTTRTVVNSISTKTFVSEIGGPPTHPKDKFFGLCLEHEILNVAEQHDG